MQYHVTQETQHIHKTNNVNARKQYYQAAGDNLLLGPILGVDWSLAQDTRA